MWIKLMHCQLNMHSLIRYSLTHLWFLHTFIQCVRVSDTPIKTCRILLKTLRIKKCWTVSAPMEDPWILTTKDFEVPYCHGNGYQPPSHTCLCQVCTHIKSPLLYHTQTTPISSQPIIGLVFPRQLIFWRTKNVKNWFSSNFTGARVWLQFQPK